MKKTGNLEYNNFSELMEDKDFFKKIHKIKKLIIEKHNDF